MSLSQTSKVAAVFVFAIVDPKDRLIFISDLSSKSAAREDPPHLDEFVLFAALDMVDRAKRTSTDAYLKVVDRFNDLLVSALAPISGIKLLLLHKVGGTLGSGEEVIRIFLQEAYTLYVRLLGNHFYELDSYIKSEKFESIIKDLGRKLLTN